MSHTNRLEGASASIESLYSLRQKLEDAGIDLGKWGKDGAKTLEDLQGEIENGEMSLEVDSEGNLFRKTAVCNANISHASEDGKIYILREDRQVFKDGNIRRREKPEAVSEKMKIAEDPRDAIVRGVKEELSLYIDRPDNYETSKEAKQSGSYPGLNTEYNFFIFNIALTKDQFKPEGYVEEDDKKTTYFVWQEKIVGK